MNINLIYTHIPAPLDRHIPDTDITACRLLNNLAEQIKQQLQQSAKDTPSATVNIITAPIENLMRKLITQARTQPASSNLNIILQLGASVQDDHWHPASGFTITCQKGNPQSDHLSDLLILQASRILGRSAIGGQPTAICQRGHSTARLLDVATAPSVLSTCLYIDNEHDADFLRSGSGIPTLAIVHAQAIREFLMLSQ